MRPIVIRRAGSCAAAPTGAARLRRAMLPGLALACLPVLAGAQQGDAASAASGLPSGRQEIRAQLIPQRYTTLGAEIGARINRLAVEEGVSFKKGQQLVVFDCSVQRALLRKAEAEESAAQRTHSANERLAELNSVGQLEFELSAAAVQRAQAEIGVQRAVTSKCAIAAPFSGRVAEQHVREQQFVQAGEPLLDVLDDSALQLEFLVPSAWATRLRVGGAFEVEIEETGQTYPAHLVRFGARVDPVSQSLKVVGAIDGTHPELMAGMSGRVRIEASTTP